MSEHLFGITVNEVLAYAAIANVVLVLLLAGITTYYAWHAKRQADASQQEVAAKVPNYPCVGMMRCADFLSSAALYEHPNTRTIRSEIRTRNEGSPAVLRYRYHNERTSLSTEAGPLLREWPSCVYHNSEGKNREFHFRAS
jgi:hypothetical protein